MQGCDYLVTEEVDERILWSALCRSCEAILPRAALFVDRDMEDVLEAPSEAAIFAAIYPVDGDFRSLVAVDTREPLTLDWRKFGEAIAVYAAAQVAADFSGDSIDRFEMCASGRAWQSVRIREEAEGTFFVTG